MSDRPVTLRLTLPMPPSINAQYTLAKGTKKRVLTKVAKEFKKKAGNIAIHAHAAARGRRNGDRGAHVRAASQR